MKRDTKDDELLGLLAAVVAEPADAGRRGVLADWLEDHGHPNAGTIRHAKIVLSSLSGERALWSSSLGTWAATHRKHFWDRRETRRRAYADLARDIVLVLGFRKCRGCGGAGRQLDWPKDTGNGPVPTKHCASCGGFGLKTNLKRQAS